MCMQCFMGAASAGAAATGIRAWVVTHLTMWVTPTRKRWLTRGLVVAGVLAAGIVGPSAS